MPESIQTLPRIVLPAGREDGTPCGKFIQLYVGEEPFFRSEEDVSRYHREIIEDSLNELGIVFGFSKLQDVPPEMRGLWVPSLKGKEYHCVGMGHLYIEASKVILSGNSFDYQLGPDEEHAERLRPYLNKMGMEMIVED
jgi:hypothetical protein